MKLKKLFKKLHFKFSTTNQVIMAAALVVIIFLAALLSSIPKKETLTPAPESSSTQEVRSGTQVARIAITRPGRDAGSLPPSPVLDETNSATAAAATNTTVPAFGRAMYAVSRFKFKINSFQKLAVQPLKFNIYDEDGQELTPEYLTTINEQKIHLIIVSVNLREFQHLNPKYEDGAWNVSANLPTPGTYEAYADITPVKGKPVVLRGELTVRARSGGKINYPGLTPQMLAITDGVNSVLNITFGALGGVSKLTFSLTRDGKNVSDIKPLYGFFGSAIVFRHTDPDAFLRTKQEAADEGKGIVDLSTIFTKAGRYTAFGEFKIGDKGFVFPVTFDVK
jgi:hypothetical protein